MEECGPCPVFASFTLAFALQLRKKHGKTSVRVRKTSVRVRKTSVRVRKTSVRVQNLSQGKKNLSQSTKPQSHVINYQSFVIAFAVIIKVAHVIESCWSLIKCDKTYFVHVNVLVLLHKFTYPLRHRYGSYEVHDCVFVSS